MFGGAQNCEAPYNVHFWQKWNFFKVRVFRKKRAFEGIFHFDFNGPSISYSLFMFADKKKVKADINYLNHVVILTCIF
jgi:hypothetical protein